MEGSAECSSGGLRGLLSRRALRSALVEGSVECSYGGLCEVLPRRALRSVPVWCSAECSSGRKKEIFEEKGGVLHALTRWVGGLCSFNK